MLSLLSVNIASLLITSQKGYPFKRQHILVLIGRLVVVQYLRQQQLSDVAGLLSLFEKPDTAKLVREVAIALMGGHYVSIPCAGGGSVSSETGPKHKTQSYTIVGAWRNKLSQLTDSLDFRNIRTKTNPDLQTQCEGRDVLVFMIQESLLMILSSG